MVGAHPLAGLVEVGETARRRSSPASISTPERPCTRRSSTSSAPGARGGPSPSIVTSARTRSGKRPGVGAHDLTAEAVSDQGHPLDAEPVEHAVQIRGVEREGVGAGVLAGAVPAQVEREHPVAIAQRLRDRVHAPGEIADAVEQDERRRVAGIAVVEQPELRSAGALDAELGGQRRGGSAAVVVCSFMVATAP